MIKIFESDVFEADESICIAVTNTILEGAMEKLQRVLR